jgi:hypothetical protein
LRGSRHDPRPRSARRRAQTIERNLRRVAERLPVNPSDLEPASDASDAVVLHLWQASQVVIDLAAAGCLL